jgi:hypothetical protein
MWQKTVSVPAQSNRSAATGLVPSLSIGDIFGPEPWYNIRPSVSQPGWMPPRQDDLDALTGSQLVIAGTIPILCSRSVVSEPALNLLAKAGLAIARNFTLYGSVDEYLSYLHGTTRKCAMQFVHPDSEFPEERYWVPRELICYLNNKANLPDLVSRPCVPERHLTKGPAPAAPAYPVVVKVASDEPSGSGRSIRICKSAAEVTAACAEFGDDRELVVEQFLSIRRNLCIQYAVLPDGVCHYLGSAEQIIDDAGIYKGNWIDGGCTPSPAAMLATRIAVERAAALGYRGFAGFDTAELGDGRIFIFDLNFRINGSTPVLLLHRSLLKRFGRQVFRVRGWPFTGSFERMTEIVDAWIDEGRFVPLSFREPVTPDAQSRVAGILIGSDRDAVRNLEEQWLALGFEG